MTFNDPGWSVLDRGGRLERWTATSAAAFSVPRMSAASDTALTSGRASC